MDYPITTSVDEICQRLNNVTNRQDLPEESATIYALISDVVAVTRALEKELYRTKARLNYVEKIVTQGVAIT